MKKRDRSTEVADLKAVAHFEDDLVLFIDSEDQNIPSSLCIKADFENLWFGEVQPLGMYLETQSYQPIHDADRRISYRQRITEEMNAESIAVMLRDFTQKRMENLENPEFLKNNYPKWQPGG